MRIRPLPQRVANQIAAGEVIERPASVVKELLENALDAKAQDIQVELEYGGLNYIAVSDNGEGIVEADLPLAIALHATSKISELSDLWSLASMGFRGEALASIAAISRLTIRSKTKTQQHAAQLQAENATFTIAPCARAQGTTVEVRDLFFNAPVRKKFLKSSTNEYQAIEAVVKRFALSAPQVGLSLTHNGKKILKLPAATDHPERVLRIQKILGKAFLEEAIYLEVEQGTLYLQGWISGHQYQRSQNDKQWFYVNYRMVKDKLLLHALKQSYEAILHPGRHPSCLLYLSLPPEEVDINVHPTKHEVRFQQPRLIHDFISKQISVGLQQSRPPLADGGGVMIPKHYSARYNPQPLPAAAEALDWRIINEQFLLIFSAKGTCLVHLTLFYQAFLKETILKSKFPLAGRQLLIEMRLSLTAQQLSILPGYIDFFQQLGIGAALQDQQLSIQTIPDSLSQLNFQKLLTQLTDSSLQFESFLDTVLHCVIFSASLLEYKDVITMIDYINQHSGLPPGCRLLDKALCNRVFDE